jgi:Flp pilus assembly protein TadG
MNRKRELCSRRSGLATIEAALVFPLLILVTFGCIEYGWIFLKSQQITNAARQGARIAARPDSTNGDVTSVINTMLSAVGIDSTDYTVSFNPLDVTTPEPGDILTVTITAPYANVDLTGAPFLPVPTNLTAAISMAKEGP